MGAQGKGRMSSKSGRSGSSGMGIICSVSMISAHRVESRISVGGRGPGGG